MTSRYVEGKGEKRRNEDKKDVVWDEVLRTLKHPKERGRREVKILELGSGKIANFGGITNEIGEGKKE